MSREEYSIAFICACVLTLFVFHLIRVRLKRHHPELFAKLGNPTSQDSNLENRYWRFQRFVLWGYQSEVTDTALISLCVLATVFEVAGVILFILAT
jgi:hypothetical protein